ncbi:MAG: indole-3-glycerol phosphate synthase TrpC [Bacteroidota bacterium]
MTILEEIVAHKRKEVNEKKELYPIKLLEKSLFYETQPISLSKYVTRSDKSGIIAEIKRRSPSNPSINLNVSIERTSIGYMQSGASALSILTDSKYFGGKNGDLTVARKFNFCPILRKDFILDEYQIIEAKSIGADAILLIAAALDEKQLTSLAEFAKNLGLEVLLEIHSKEEITDEVLKASNILGINNRNLKTMEVSLENSVEMFDHLPRAAVKISESGIKTPEDVLRLRSAGYHGFLIGELFMKHGRPERACMKFIDQLQKLEAQLA